MIKVAWAIPGLMLPLLFPALPGKTALILIFLFLSSVLVKYKRYTPLLVLLGMSWTIVHLYEGLGARLSPGLNESAEVFGFVSSLPVVRGDLVEFKFKVNESSGSTFKPGTTLLLRWYQGTVQPGAGEFWKFKIRLKPARSRLNFTGADREKWYFANRVAAVGIVEDEEAQFLAIPINGSIPAWRQNTRNKINHILDEHPSRAILLALAIADRSEISSADWNRYRITGTSHLLAISGMHIGLAALLGFWMGRFVACVFPLQFLLLHGLKLGWALGATLAICYALLSGMGPSTSRALVMVTALTAVCLLRRRVGVLNTYFLAVLMVLFLNPMAPLNVGFWFSFLAVALLIIMFSPRYGRSSLIKSSITAQAGLVLVMLPLGMFCFQQATLLGLLSNFVAIPWVSFGVVPAMLLSIMSFPTDTWVPEFLLYSSAESLRWLDILLRIIEEFGPAFSWTTHKPGIISTLLASTGGVLLLLPVIFRARFIALLLVLPMCFPNRSNRQQLQLELLDIGQGLALLVKTSNHLMLYDTGPGNGMTWSMFNSTVFPVLSDSWPGTPNLAIVSHGDLDHAGGIHDLKAKFPDVPLLANLRRSVPEVSSCNEKWQWKWDGVDFRVLHPSRGLNYQGNDSSCVISINFGSESILLTGDISEKVEQRLTILGLRKHDILVVAHHGSKSSSGSDLIKVSEPKFALISSAFQNRFGFPHASVVERFRHYGIPLIDTSKCGAVRITLEPGQTPVLESARRARKAIWHWPADVDCP